MSDADSDIIYCEVCALHHRAGVERCEECKHLLGTPANWGDVRDELSHLNGQVLLGAGALLGMVALNYWAFGGAGYIILLAPVVWAVTNFYRRRVLVKALARENGGQNNDGKSATRGDDLI